MSKKCPQCGSVYTDQTLKYCLTDGTPLSFDSSVEKTLLMQDSDSKETIPHVIETGENLAEKTTSPGLLAESEDSGPSTGKGFVFYVGLFLGAVLLIGIGALIGLNLAGPDTKQYEPVGQNTEVDKTDKAEAENTSSGTERLTKTYRVTGVSRRDVLYIRPAPGNLKVRLGAIPPDGVGIVVTGPGKRSGKSLWVPIRYEATSGWVNSRFLAEE